MNSIHVNSGQARAYTQLHTEHSIKLHWLTLTHTSSLSVQIVPVIVQSAPHPLFCQPYVHFTTVLGTSGRCAMSVGRVFVYHFSLFTWTSVIIIMVAGLTTTVHSVLNHYSYRHVIHRNVWTPLHTFMTLSLGGVIHLSLWTHAPLYLCFYSG